MKRIICLITALCLVFGSFSFVFAVDWSTTDSSNLASIKNAVNSGGGLYNLISTISGRLVFNNVSIAQMVQNIYNALYSSSGGTGRSVAWWLSTLNENLVTLMGWIDPNSSQSMTGILNQILNALIYSDAGGMIHSWLEAIEGYNYQTAERILSLNKALINYKNGSQSWTSADRTTSAHYQLIGDNGLYGVYVVSANGQKALQNKAWYNGTPLGNLAVLLQNISNNQAFAYEYEYAYGLSGYNVQQSGLSWIDIEQSVTFTPTSATNGIYSWLKNIQAPVARLSYVLASDQRIEAQELAADNEQAVVDNFIDPSGSGSASVSDFGSISDLSSGYQNNFGSSASVTGIFNIFDSNNFGWFSQETANQLDTSSNNSRAKYESEFDTPLLDQRINDIYDALGVKP